MSRNSISLLYSFVVTVLLCYGPHLCSCFQQIVRSNKHPFFHHDRSTQNNNNRIIKTTKSCSELYFFNFGKKDNDKNEETTGEDKITTQERKEEISFFDRITRRITKNDDEDDIIKSSVEVGNAVVGTPAGIPTSKSISELSVITQPVLELTPMELATKLRADAQKARLEAEKMDAELTLKKIGRLEKELEYARTHPEKTNTELSQQMQREMDSLQAKFRGETIPPVTTNAAALVSGTTSVSKTITADAAPNGNQNLERYSNETLFQGKLSSIIKPIDSKILEANVREFEKVPSFFKKTTAMALGITFDTVDDINVTDIVVRQDMINRLDFSFTNLSPPKFTLKQIQEMETELLEKEAENNVWWKRFSAQELPEQIVEQRTSGIAKDNITEFALLVLEFEYYLEYISNIIPDALDKELEKDELGKLLQGEEWFEPLQKRLNSTFADSLVESFYPKCTRKEDKEPTSHQVQLLISDILPKATFQVTSKMEKISGGYIIRGKTKLNGDELIEKIETLIDKSPSLSDKMTVLYTSDFTDFENIQQVDPIIYVVGSDIVRESKPIQLSIVSAIGIATSWYLSLYPFLLNPNIASRVDEQIAIADASMTPDLGFLTDLSLPLFATFLSIQLAHEIAHIVVGSLNNVRYTKTIYFTEKCQILSNILSPSSSFFETCRSKQVHQHLFLRFLQVLQVALLLFVMLPRTKLQCLIFLLPVLSLGYQHRY